MVAQQDAVFKSKKLQDARRYSKGEGSMRNRAATVWNGKGLNALMLVSKGFFDLVAPFVLKKLHSKKMEDQIFIEVLSKKSPKLFRTLILDVGSPELLETIITTASLNTQLPRSETSRDYSQDAQNHSSFHFRNQAFQKV